MTATQRASTGRRHATRIAALIVSLAVLASLTNGPGASAAPSETSRWVVTYRTSSAAAAADSARPIGSRWAVADLSTAAAAALRSRPDVLAVEPDVKVRAAVQPNDPCLVLPCVLGSPLSGPSQWWPSHVGMAPAWTTSMGAGSTIAVLDTAIDGSVPDLAGKIVAPSFNATDYPGDTQPQSHGTLTAGVAAARTNDGVGIAGAGWAAGIVPIEVLAGVCHIRNSGMRPTGLVCGAWREDIKPGEGLLSWIVAGIDQAVASGARVLNLSLASDTPSTAMQASVDRAAAAGRIVVAAAGNFSSGDHTVPQFPAAYASVISVAATGHTDALASFSAYGPYVDIAAPGVDIPGPAVGGGTTSASGTSFSTPIVSGVVALLLAHQPGLLLDDVRLRLVETARALPDQFQTALLDAGAALTSVDPYGRFAGGAFVARGLLASGRRVITGAGAGGGPHVRPFDTSGNPIGGGFFAYDGNFTGGVRVAIAGGRVVTAPGPGGGPNVRTFASDGGGILSSFFAYDPAFAGGVRVAGGNTIGATEQIVTGPGPGGGPDVRIFAVDGMLLQRFFAYSPSFVGGVTVAVCHAADASARIVTGAGPGGGPHVNVLTPTGQSTGGFFAFDANFHGGVTVACGDVVPGIPGDEIVVGPGPGGGPNLRVFTLSGQLLSSTFAFYSPLTGGLEVAADSTGLNAALTQLTNGVRFLPEPP